METKPINSLITFNGGDTGAWKVTSLQAVSGEGLPMAPYIHIVKGEGFVSPVKFQLRAFISNLRYTERSEKTVLDAHSIPLGNPSHTCAALIPIKKSEEWWKMTQEERRDIFERKSNHIANSVAYLPFISRQLHHCRDLGEEYDFITWFEFAPEHQDRFDELSAILRTSEEWKYVIRETDIRLISTT